MSKEYGIEIRIVFLLSQHNTRAQKKYNNTHAQQI